MLLSSKTQLRLAADRQLDLQRRADIERRIRRANEDVDDPPAAASAPTWGRPLIERLLAAVTRS